MFLFTLFFFLRKLLLAALGPSAAANFDSDPFSRGINDRGGGRNCARRKLVFLCRSLTERKWRATRRRSAASKQRCSHFCVAGRLIAPLSAIFGELGVGGVGTEIYCLL